MKKYVAKVEYEITLPDDTEEVLEAEFDEDTHYGIMTDLIAEVQNNHVDAIQGNTGITKLDMVYLERQEEMWTAGWYNIADMPVGWEGSTVEILRRIISMRGPDSVVRVVVSGIECKFKNWDWEGAE